MWKLLRNIALVAIVLAGVLKLLAWYVAGQAVQRAVAKVAPYAQVKYERVSAGLDGSIGLSNVTVAPAGSHRLYRADTVVLESPGLYWLLARDLSQSQQLPPTFGISVRGLKLPPGLSWLKSQWFDAATLVPFPTLGCDKPALTGSDYLKMGVNTGTAHEHLEYRYDARAHSLDLVLTLTAPGFSRVILEAELSKFDPAALATATLRDKLHVDQLSVDYSDLGYLQRRSRFCAEHIGIAPKQFIARHEAAVQELLKQHRITPSDGLLQLYRKLLADGGKVSILSLPSPNFGLRTWRTNTPDEVLRQLNVTARYQDAPPIMFRLAFAAPIESVPSDQIPVAGDATPTIPETMADKVAPAGAPTVAVVSTAPVPAPEPHKPIAAAAPVPALHQAELTPAAPRARAPVLASGPPPPSGSTLALVWKNTVEDLPEAMPQVRDYSVIEYAQLGGKPGRRVRLVTDGGKLIEGYVMGADAGGVQLRVVRNSGDAQFEVPKARIRQIQLLKH